MDCNRIEKIFFLKGGLPVILRPNATEQFILSKEKLPEIGVP